MIIKKEKKNNVMIYYVKKDKNDEKMALLKNTYVKPSQINLIINEDADVYNVDNNQLLLKFRKNKLSDTNVKDFFDNVIDFAMKSTNNRGSTSGSKSKNVWKNPKIKSNIIGYFDRLSPIQKFLIKKKNANISLSVRECRFNVDYPEKYKKLIPLVKEIDSFYKKQIPDKYQEQFFKAKQTPFKIADTCFTTITTNVNFQTSIHKDKGDDIDGFGNLVVIEEGKYSGGETCLPQFGIGVNVRTGDILLMDVHEWHGNLPIKEITPNAIRLSIVCYLRYNIWKNTKNKTKKFMLKHNKTIKKLRKNG
jgi:hypothetical protein